MTYILIEVADRERLANQARVISLGTWAASILLIAFALAPSIRSNAIARAVLIFASCGMTAVSRATAGNLATHDRVLQDFRDISDNQRQQLIYEALAPKQLMKSALAPIAAELPAPLPVHNLSRTISQTLKSTVMLGAPRAGKGYAIARAVQQLPANVDLWLIDPKDDPNESYYWSRIPIRQRARFDVTTLEPDAVTAKVTGLFEQFLLAPSSADRPKLLIVDECSPGLSKGMTPKAYKAFMGRLSTICSVGPSKGKFVWIMALSSALVKISLKVCRLLVGEDYSDARNSLFERIASVPNLVFVYEDILFGEDRGASKNSHKPYPDKAILDEALKFLRQYQLEITPYKKNAEVTVIAESFLDDTERNLIFRLYFPNEKLWSEEADKFLRLFHDYLSKVDQLSVRLDQKRTAHGTIYEFHGQPPSGEHDLSREFQDFSELMDTCALDVDAAAALISFKALDARKVTGLIKKYTKESRRLQLDIKHEAESKIISIRHRLESELIDLDPTAEDWETINSVVELVISAFSKGPLPLPSQILGKSQYAQQITYNIQNIQPQFIKTVRGVVAQEVSGTQHFSSEHHEILKLIRDRAPANMQDLETAVYEIADESGKQADKLKASQKIKAFLIEAGKKTSDIAFAILQKYIESQLGF